MAKKISKIEIVENDVFSSIRESAVKTEPSVDMLKTALQEIIDLQTKIKKEASNAKNSFAGSAMNDQKSWNDHVKKANDLYEKNTLINAPLSFNNGFKASNLSLKGFDLSVKSAKFIPKAFILI